MLPVDRAGARLGWRNGVSLVVIRLEGGPPRTPTAPTRRSGASNAILAAPFGLPPSVRFSLFLVVCLVASLQAAASSAVAEGGFGEVGANDFRISFIEGTGNPAFDADFPDVAYNPAADEYLVVFRGHRECAVTGGVDREIFTRRISAGGGLLGSSSIVSSMGPVCDPMYLANDPAVVYNATADEYLVVWSGEEEMFAHLTNNEFEIFGQRLDGEGRQIGDNDFRISDMGGTGDPDYDALAPAVAWNATANQYLVVWVGNDDEDGQVEGALEIFGQLLDTDGTEIGVNDFRISDMGGLGDASFSLGSPAVAWNALDNEYLVVWDGQEEVGGVPIQREILGQRLNENGTAQGVNDFRISDMGGSDDSPFVAAGSSVAWSSTTNEYLVVWVGSDDEDGQVEDEFEIFGQRLSSAGSEVGANDFRISDAGGLGDIGHIAAFPSVVWSPGLQEYFVVWWGTDDKGGLWSGEYEIFGQRLDINAAETGSNDFRISDMGGTGENGFFGRDPRVAWNEQDEQYLVVWFGSDDEDGQVEGEFEIFGQRLGVECPIFLDGFESGDIGAWSSGAGAGSHGAVDE